METPDSYSASLWSPPAWKVWLSWVLYTVLGYLLSWTFATAPAVMMPESGGQILGYVLGFVGFALVGLAQWLVLRRCLPGISWWGWTLATMAGQVLRVVAAVFLAVGLLLFDVIGDLPDMIGVSATLTLVQFVNGFLLGLPLGFAQWILLRRYVSRAAWWIPAVGLATGLNNIVPLVGGIPALLLTSMASWALFAAVTGLMLVWLLRKPRKLPEQRIAVVAEQPIA